MVTIPKTSQIAASLPQFPYPRDFTAERLKKTVYIVEVTELKH